MIVDRNSNLNEIPMNLIRSRFDNLKEGTQHLITLNRVFPLTRYTEHTIRE